jgi:hypothetical protein
VWDKMTWQAKKYSVFDDCVSFYDFHNDAKDLISGNDGTVTGATLITNHLGQTNSAYYFDGSGNNISIPYITGNNVGANFTWSVWFNITNADDSRELLLCYTSSQYHNVRLYVADDGYLKFTIYNTPTDLVGQSTGAQPSVGEWHHAVMTCNYSNSVYVYLDGEEVYNHALSAFSYGGTRQYNPTFVSFDNALLGSVSSVEIWNSILTAGEVKQLYEISKNKNVTPLIRGGRK